MLRFSNKLIGIVGLNLIAIFQAVIGRLFVAVSRPLLQKGYTLTELLIVITLIAAVGSIAFPDPEQFFAMQKTANEASVLVADIRLARSWAMANQNYTRLIFSNDYSSWIVQEYTTSDGTPIIGEPSNPDDSAHLAYDENAVNWKSILDVQSRTLMDPDIIVTVTPSTPPKIFFGPDGVLKSKPSMSASPIGRIKVQFTKGDIATMDVDISPAGVLESTEYYSEYY